MHAKATTLIPLRSTSIVPIHLLSVANQDFLFEPIKLDYLSLFSHVINASVKGILVKNSTSKPIQIHQNMQLGYLQKLGTEQTLVASAFLRTTKQDLAIIAKRPPYQRRIGWFTKAIAMLSATYVAAPTFTSAPSTFINTTTLVSKPETVLSNRVTIYSLLSSLDVTKLAKVVNKFLII
jgi:hypothetical protein